MSASRRKAPDVDPADARAVEAMQHRDPADFMDADEELEAAMIAASRPQPSPRLSVRVTPMRLRVGDNIDVNRGLRGVHAVVVTAKPYAEPAGYVHVRVRGASGDEYSVHLDSLRRVSASRRSS